MISDVVAVSAMTIIGGLVTLIVTRWLNRIDLKLAKMDVKQDVIHGDVNGKMEKLLEATGAAKKAEGKAEAEDVAEAKAAGIAEKQVEIDQLNKNSEPKK